MQRAAEARIVMAGGDEQLGHQIFEVFQANLRAIMRFVPEPYPGKVTLIRAAEQAASLEVTLDPLLGWGPWAEQVEVHEIPGSHVHMIDEPNVNHLAKILDRCLAQADR